MTRHITITWDRPSLLNLVVRRLLRNVTLRDLYGVQEDEVLHDARKQEDLFYRVFPAQADAGKKKRGTIEWMLTRTCDASKHTAPRELIHLLSCAREAQLRRLEIGHDEPGGEQLFDRMALKEALPAVSKVRLEQTLYAEAPGLRPWLQKLQRKKTQQTLATLAAVWQCDEDGARSLANQLAEVGFFERQGPMENPVFWVPFLYRGALNMVQGSAA